RLQFRPLHQEGRARKELVAAAMVEVQMGVRDVPHVVRAKTEPRELRNHVVALGGLHAEPLGALLAEPADRIDPRLAMNAGVEEQPAAWMIDEKAHDGYGPRLAGREIRQHARPIQLDVARA